MKKIIALLISVSLVAPMLASAQSVDVQSNQLILTNLLQQLLTLYETELQSLEAQLASLQTEVNGNSTVAIASSSDTEGQIGTATSTYTPSQTLVQIETVIPEVVTTTEQLGGSSAPNGIIDPITENVITTSSEYWFLGYEKGSQVFGVFSSSTPDVTISWSGYVIPFNDNMMHWFSASPYTGAGPLVMGCLNNFIIGENPNLNYGQGETFTLEQELQIPTSTIFTIHNDNGTLQVIASPSLSSDQIIANPGIVINTSSIPTFPYTCSANSRFPFGGVEME
jgi:hypothetical protein